MFALSTLRPGRRLFARRAARCLSAASANHDPKTGSSYENYSMTSKTYDNYRAPIGLDVLRQALSDNASLRGLSASNLYLLDAGCGSGNYLQELKGDVGKVKGLEFNEGMIEQANKKGLDVVQGSITDMPFKSGEFDVAMTTQVLHHLVAAGGGGESGFGNVAQACEEVHRVLKPGGIWMVSTQTPEQHVDGFWWAPVIPEAAEKLSKNFPPLDRFEAMLRSAGFETFETIIPPVPLVREDLYRDIEGPFKQEFRNADSTWSLATKEELEAGLEWLKAKIAAGEGEKFLADREAIRAKIGQTTTVITRKSM